MITSPISLQDLRRRIYVTAKAEKTKRFWGLYVHVVKRETLRTAYALAKRNNGAPGLTGSRSRGSRRPASRRFSRSFGTNWSRAPIGRSGTGAWRSRSAEAPCAW